MKNLIHTCCFIGHREIEESDHLKNRLKKTIEWLITKENVDTFLFGSKSHFNNLCHEIVTEIKEKYPHIKRVYVRAEFPYIDDFHKSCLLKKYEYTYYPTQAIGAGKATYIKRNYEMIEHSRFCVFYFDESLSLPYKSGTKIAFDYAVKLKKELFRFP